MGYTVYYSNAEITANAGFGMVARLPCIFDERPGYHRLASRYLIDRGLGLWQPVTRGGVPRGLPPGGQTMRNYAHWLANFLEWVDRRAIDLLTCEYVEHIHGRYQDEMLNGAWSRDGTALSARTVNLRVQQSCDFLTWMADKGYRNQFHVPTESFRIRGGVSGVFTGHITKNVSVRKGKVRQTTRRLRMPTDSQVKFWLDAVYEKFGHTKGLMCETVLLTAIRREEVSCWRVDTLPENPDEWHINDHCAPRIEQRVLVNIKFGVKGTCYGYSHGDKIGPERRIWIPLHLAERIHDYRMKQRNQSLRRWVKAASTLAEQRRRIKEAVHLFINDETGKRINSKEFYNAWTGVELPYKGWSPHLGRHWWSCSILWCELKKHEHLLNVGGHAAATLLESCGMSVITLIIQPQLGHADLSTSMIYLQWAADMLNFNLTIQYESELDGPEVQ